VTSSVTGPVMPSTMGPLGARDWNRVILRSTNCSKGIRLPPKDFRFDRREGTLSRREVAFVAYEGLEGSFRESSA